MKRSPILLTALLAILAGSAAARSPAERLFVPQDPLVGTWTVDVVIGPCGQAPVQSFSAYNTFHAGGTLTDVNTLSPTLRAGGQGIWQRMSSGDYATRFQFFRFDQPAPAGATGIQDIRTTVTLAPDGKSYVASVRARITTLDGVQVSPNLCGEAIGKRLPL